MSTPTDRERLAHEGRDNVQAERALRRHDQPAVDVRADRAERHDAARALLVGVRPGEPAGIDHGRADRVDDRSAVGLTARPAHDQRRRG